MRGQRQYKPNSPPLDRFLKDRVHTPSCNAHRTCLSNSSICCCTYTDSPSIQTPRPHRHPVHTDSPSIQTPCPHRLPVHTGSPSIQTPRPHRTQSTQAPRPHIHTVHTDTQSTQTQSPHRRTVHIDTQCPHTTTQGNTHLSIKLEHSQLHLTQQLCHERARRCRPAHCRAAKRGCPVAASRRASASVAASRRAGAPVATAWLAGAPAVSNICIVGVGVGRGVCDVARRPPARPRVRQRRRQPRQPHQHCADVDDVEHAVVLPARTQDGRQLLDRAGLANHARDVRAVPAARGRALCSHARCTRFGAMLGGGVGRMRACGLLIGAASAIRARTGSEAPGRDALTREAAAARGACRGDGLLVRGRQALWERAAAGRSSCCLSCCCCCCMQVYEVWAGAGAGVTYSSALPASLSSCLSACLSACLPACLFACMHPCIPVYVHA
eukprot:358859-Chlamydomonas_euryale.AAC.23